MTKMHFEDLWEKCENYHKSNEDQNSPLNMDELIMKIGLYQSLNEKPNISKNDLKTIKSRLLGEILFSISNISLKDDINVYQAMLDALNSR